MKRELPVLSRPALLIAGILLIATTLRAPVTGIAPVLEIIRSHFELGAGGAGALTTLPLLAFAAASPFAVLFAREYGLERSLFGALASISAGIVLRSAGPAWCLFLGTAVLGVGIAIANVLLPSLLKRDFPDRIASLTGAYSVTAGAAAAIASVAAVPIAGIAGAGWNWALASFVVFPLAAMTIWTPQLAGRTRPTQNAIASPHEGPVWRSGLAWQVTLFFGLNSLVYYVVAAWLPAMLIEAGYSPAAAGSLHGVSQFATAIPGLVFGIVMARFSDQRLLAFILPVVTAISIMGIWLAPQFAVLWVLLFGAGAGATFILALAFIGLRTTNTREAAALSGMAQLVGYLIAAGAPPAAGFLHDQSQGWSLPLMICLIFCMVLAGVGLGAGRPLRLFADARP